MHTIALEALAAETLPELPPAPRPERELNMRPHQIPRRCCSPYQS